MLLKKGEIGKRSKEEMGGISESHRIHSKGRRERTTLEGRSVKCRKGVKGDL